MAAFRLLLCFFVATCFCSLINAAAVHKLIFGGQIDAANDLGDRPADAAIANDLDGSIRARRAIEYEVEPTTKRLCHSTTPCGWAVYIPFTRQVDYFMKNTCTCPTALKCIRTDDDLSVSAYVYRCRNNVSETDIGAPDDANSN